MSLLLGCPAAPYTEVHADDASSSGSDAGSSSGAVIEPGTSTGDDTTSTTTTTGDDTTSTGGDASSTSTGQPHDPLCGDAVVDPGEVCDDGNAADDDDCLSTCEAAACGDGFLHTGHEACDDGNGVDDDACSNACVSASCGDGVVQPGEACDDGNDLDADTCTNACNLPVCGDGIHQTAEACDDAGPSPACDADCSLAECGDSVVNTAAGEACDDGKASPTCDADCSPAACGDGQLSPLAGEVCDDGNLSDDDSCSSTCDKLRRIVFVTSATYTGNLGGLAGADAKCQALASAAGLSGKFYAWLSAGVTSPNNRFLKSAVPYVLTSGIQVAKHYADLTDGTLQHAIDTTEKKTVAPTSAEGCGGAGKAMVWTNTAEAGAAWESNGCTAWTGTGDIARLGHAKATNFSWTRFCAGQAASCGWHAALYCVEQ